MSFQGTVQNGVVVLDDHSQLAEGTRVEVILQEESAKRPSLRDRLARLAGTANDLPADMARNQHSYIHGAPKK